MKIAKILAKVGTSVLKQVIPGAGVVIDTINAFLPEDNKLPAEATGDQAITAINQLPATEQAMVLQKELDIEIAEIEEWTKRVDALARADAAGSSTRPQIAKMMAWLVVISGFMFVFAWALSIATDDVETLKALADSWQMMLAVLGTPTALLRAYFGMREREKKTRYTLAGAQNSGFLKDIVGLFKK